MIAPARHVWARLSTLRRVPGRDRFLIAEALILLVSVRAALRLLPFGRLLRILDRLARLRSLKTAAHSEPSRVFWSVEVGSRYLPAHGICLVRALAARTMLARRGYRVELRIGVARSGGLLQAHAWLEGPDGCALGNGDCGDGYVSLCPAIGCRGPR
jgi:hypothetical protein